MSIDIEVLRQIATVDSLLAGLALSAATRINSLAGDDVQKKYAIGTLLTTSLLLVTSAAMAIFLISQRNNITDFVIAIKNIFIFISLFGITEFLAGIVQVGWLVEKTIGIILLIGSVFSAIITWYMFLR